MGGQVDCSVDVMGVGLACSVHLALASYHLAFVPFSACLASPHSLLPREFGKLEMEAGKATQGSGLTLQAPSEGLPILGTLSVAPGSGTVNHWVDTEPLAHGCPSNPSQHPCHSDQHHLTLDKTWMPETHLHTRLITSH